MKERYEVLYRRLHAFSEWFCGATIVGYKDRIAELVRETSATTLLDYGCGKGAQYLGHRIHEAWGVLPRCYDVGVNYLSEKPTGTFDGVLCCDVLEHIAREDLSTVVDDIVKFANKFVFLVIGVHTTEKKFSDGRSIHLTVEPIEWWEEEIIAPVRRLYPHLLIEVHYDSRQKALGKIRPRKVRRRRKR